MIDDRIGIIGKTQGVKASSRPTPKNAASVAQMLPSASRLAMASCSLSAGAPEPLLSAPAGAAAAASGINRDRVFLIGG